MSLNFQKNTIRRIEERDNRKYYKRQAFRIYIPSKEKCF